MTPQHISRLHALDGLRAAMMLLGLVLHSAVSYTVTPIEAWSYQDRSTNMAFDVMVFIIHLFRMPTFFVMAGFFAAFLWHRDGPGGLMTHRIRRVLVPLVLAWIVTFPMTRFAAVFAQAGGAADGLAAATTVMSTPYGEPALIHLWFLYYLMIFYVVALALGPLGRRLPEVVQSAADRSVAVVVRGWWGVGVLAVVTMASLAPMEIPALETSTSFLPAVRVLAAYLVFFGFGWLLFRRNDLVPAFSARAWQSASLGVMAGLVYSQVLLARQIDPLLQHVSGIALAALATWLLVSGSIGLFVRYCDAPSPVWRYLADGAYWIYLVHLPFVFLIAGALSPLSWPAALKFAVTLTGTTLVSVVTYHYGVRSTVVGVLLNGRRYARALPPRAPDALPKSVPVP